AIATTQVHASILRIATSFSRGLVFTTNAFTPPTRQTSWVFTANRKVRNFFEVQLSRECAQKIFRSHQTAEAGLARTLGYVRARRGTREAFRADWSDHRNAVPQVWTARIIVQPKSAGINQRLTETHLSD